VDEPRDQSGAEENAAENGQGERSGDADTSAVAIALGDTAEITALDPHEDYLPEIAGAAFPIVLRGYDRAAVDAYVIRVTELVAELQAVRSPKAAVKKALDRVGRETASILQHAQEAADEMTAQSRSRAEERRREAEREAARIVGDAHEQVRRLDSDTEALWAERRRLIEDVQRIADALRDSADAALARFPAEDEAQAIPDNAPEAPYDLHAPPDDAQATPTDPLTPPPDA
jgi:cell division septum initiation protein DivIVA